MIPQPSERRWSSRRQFRVTGRLCAVVIVGASALFLLSGLTGCSDGAVASDESLENQLRRRVTEFWETRLLMHKIYEDEQAYDELLAKQFGYWDPEFKKQMRLSDYRASRGSAVYDRFRLGEVHIDGDVGWVNVSYDWRIAKPPAGMKSEATLTTSDLTDSEWILADGVWYKLFDAKKAFGGGAGRRPNRARQRATKESASEATQPK